MTSTATTAEVDGITTQLNVQAAIGVKNDIDAVKTTKRTVSDDGAPVDAEQRAARRWTSTR